MVNDEHFFPLTDWFDVPLIWLGQTCWNKRFLSRCFKFPIDFYWLWNRLSWCWIFWRVLTPGGGLCLAFVWFQSESVSFLRYLFVCVVGMLLDQVMIDLAALEQRWDNDVTIDRWNAWERLGTLGNAWERYCWPNDAPICYPDSNWLIFEEEKRKRKCRWFIFPFHLIFHRKLGRENKCHCSLPPPLFLSLSLSLSFSALVTSVLKVNVRVWCDDRYSVGSPVRRLMLKSRDWSQASIYEEERSSDTLSPRVTWYSTSGWLEFAPTKDVWMELAPIRMSLALDSGRMWRRGNCSLLLVFNWIRRNQL